MLQGFFLLVHHTLNSKKIHHNILYNNTQEPLHPYQHKKNFAILEKGCIFAPAFARKERGISSVG